MLCRLELNIHGQDESSNLRGGKWTSAVYKIFRLQCGTGCYWNMYICIYLYPFAVVATIVFRTLSIRMP